MASGIDLARGGKFTAYGGSMCGCNCLPHGYD